MKTKHYLPLIALAALLAGVFLFLSSDQVSAGPLPLPTAVPCGDGYESDDYGFSYSLDQYHWTVDWEGYVSESTVDQVDRVLDGLFDDNIAQTMILIKSASEVGNRTNCAVHFLRYMGLGLVQGERKDNGFVFLIVVEENSIDVHYGVGLGLPALTAQGLSPLNRLAEDTYDETGSLDEALLALVDAYDEYARSKYDPWKPGSPTSPTAVFYSDNQSNPIAFDSPFNYLITCCIVCLVLMVVLMFIFLVIRFGGRGGRVGRGPVVFRPSRPRPTTTFRPRPPRVRMPTRRGGGSGRSGRGN